MTEPGRGPARTGVVDSFDVEKGLGTVLSKDGVTYQFHCIEVADGTRSVEVGTEVVFDVLAKFGRYEASNVRS